MFHPKEREILDKKRELIEFLVADGINRGKANAIANRENYEDVLDFLRADRFHQEQKPATRKMKQSGKDGQTIEVIELIILKNCWEIYVIEKNGDRIFSLTYGDFTELGYHSYEEIKPHILHVSKDLYSIAPAPNWEWV